MRIYLKNILADAEFHLEPIWNDGALGFFEDVRSNKKNNNKMSSDMWSVPDPIKRRKCSVRHKSATIRTIVFTDREESEISVQSIGEWAS